MAPEIATAAASNNSPAAGRMAVGSVGVTSQKWLWTYWFNYNSAGTATSVPLSRSDWTRLMPARTTACFIEPMLLLRSDRLPDDSARCAEPEASLVE